MDKLIIAGGSGFLGEVLIQHFKDKVQEIVVLSRQEKSHAHNVRYVLWDAQTIGSWQCELDACDVVINLVGKSVDCRYTKANKSEILRSRVDSTRILNEAVLSSSQAPKHFINSSTATIYEHSLHEPNDEFSGKIGSGFSVRVAQAWEDTFFESETPATLKTVLRTSIVLGKNGGALIPIRKITACGLGGKQGDGQQMVSWIHELDFARAVAYVIDKKLDGAINIVAPHPIKNEQFMEQVRKTMGVKFGLNAHKTLLEIGALFMQTETELILKSRFVIPRRLLNAGFQFEYANINAALSHLLS